MKSVAFKPSKVLSVLMSIALVVASFSFGMTAQAKTPSELSSEKEKIQSEIDSAQSKINELSSQNKETAEYLHA